MDLEDFSATGRLSVERGQLQVAEACRLAIESGADRRPDSVEMAEVRKDTMNWLAGAAFAEARANGSKLPDCAKAHGVAAERLMEAQVAAATAALAKISFGGTFKAIRHIYVEDGERVRADGLAVVVGLEWMLRSGRAANDWTLTEEGRTHGRVVSIAARFQSADLDLGNSFLALADPAGHRSSVVVRPRSRVLLDWVRDARAMAEFRRLNPEVNLSSITKPSAFRYTFGPSTLRRMWTYMAKRSGPASAFLRPGSFPGHYSPTAVGGMDEIKAAIRGGRDIEVLAVIGQNQRLDEGFGDAAACGLDQHPCVAVHPELGIWSRSRTTYGRTIFDFGKRDPRCSRPVVYVDEADALKNFGTAGNEARDCLFVPVVPDPKGRVRTPELVAAGLSTHHGSVEA